MHPPSLNMNVRHFDRPRKCLIVSGMHRSGTSALTRTLSLLGAALPKDLMPPTEFNEKGYFESEDIADLNDQILRAYDSSWYELHHIDDASLDQCMRRDFRDQIRATIDGQFSDAPIFVVKDPRISRLVPIWRDVLDELHVDTTFVLPIRHPFEVASSLKKRDDFSFVAGCLLWLRYILDAEFQSRGRTRLFVRYSELLSDPLKIAQDVIATIGDARLALTTDAERQIASFLDPSLRHHRIDNLPPSEIGAFAAWLESAHAAQIDLISDPDDVEAKARMDDVRLEFERATSAFLPLIAAAQTTDRTAELTAQIAKISAQMEAAKAAAKRRENVQRNEVTELKAFNAMKDARLRQQEAKLADMERTIVDLQSSMSWRMTAPMRAAKTFLKSATRHGQSVRDNPIDKK